MLKVKVSYYVKCGRREDVVCGVWAHARVGRAGKLHQWPRAAANSCRKRAGRSQLSRTAEERLRNYGATYPRGWFDLSVISVDKT